MKAQEFLDEFERIILDFQFASNEINKTAWFRFIKTARLFREMRKSNLEMEMLGLRVKAEAIKSK